MAYYYKINEPDDLISSHKGFRLQKAKKNKNPSEPSIKYDFSKHVLIELLDDTTPEKQLWEELGLTGNKNILHKRMMIDSHRIKCRRAILICINSDEAKHIAKTLSQKKVMKRCVCAVVIQDLLTDLCLFEKQIMQCGDKRPQQQLLYVSDLNRCREPAGLVRFLKEKFSSFGTILSVFVCADDDGYAFPEGVIKFAYLSEAFAAELAFDQYVVGKERLSVTAHHNILLSQCDLRVRLRNAQCNNNADINAILEPPLHSSYPSYELNGISFHNGSHNFNSTDTLKEVNFDNDENISVHFNKLDISYSKTKLFNSKLNMFLSKNNESAADCYKNINMHLHCMSSNDKKPDDCMCVPNNNSLNNIVNYGTTAIYEDPTMPINLNVDDQFSENSVVRNSTKNIDSGVSFHCSSQKYPGNDLNPKTVQEYSIKKCPENESNSGSYHTCNHDDQNISFHSNSYLSPDNTILCNAEWSFNKNSTVTQEQPKSLKLKAVSSMSEGTKSKLAGKSSTKSGSKRKKHFTPSQKLCLKSQRIALSQSESQNTNINNNSTCALLPLSQSKPLLENTSGSTRDLSSENLSCLPSDVWGPTKVNSWLSDLPNSHNRKVSDIQSNFVNADAVIDDCSISTSRRISVHPSYPLKERNSFNIQNGINDCYTDKISVENRTNMCNQEFRLSTNQHMRRISVHPAPSLKSENYIDIQCGIRSSCSDLSAIENEDPNEVSAMISHKSTVQKMQESITPLQNWLKQELLYSTNNNVAKSQDTAKSIIVCAAKTRDIIISVGCSHVTCDTCYPESTTLLLGYC